jgi:diguanylate cyclase (GGDEF)-like protein/PAS domain S-box-containing protein
MYRVAGVDRDGFAPSYHGVINIFHQADRARIKTILKTAMDRRDSFEFQTSIVRADGVERDVLVQGKCETEGDTLIALFGFLQDITERRVAEEALRRSESFYRAIVEVQSELIFRCLYDGVVTFANQAFCRFFDIHRNDAVGAVLFKCEDSETPVMSVDTAAALKSALEKLTPEAPKVSAELAIADTNGSDIRWLLCTHQALFDHRGTLIEYQTVALDITQRKLADTKIEFLAHHDPLTGLPNRALFQDRLDIAVAHADRSDRRAAVLLLDLDNFKYVNDALGHGTGDGLLRVVAERLKECVRAVDTVARLGGDEFVIIQSGIESADQAVILAERIRKKITQPFEIDGHDIHTGTSIGITVYPDDSTDLDQVLKNADLALYRAKGREKGTFEFYSTELGQTAQNRLDIAAGLRRAITVEGELSLAFQPKFSLASGMAVGVEALLRWNRPGHGAVPPGEFIPVAEATGLILPVGEWVMRRACRHLKDWEEAGVPLVPLSVNISAAQFRDRSLVRMIRQCIEDVGIDPTLLEIEITETALMRDSESATEILRELVGVGLSVSIDDFGTGYSSLNDLKRFPVQKLKIDRSFVSGIGNCDEDAAIAHAVTQLGHSLGLSVLAEGVETKAEFDTLRDLGCDEVQGFLMSRPISADDFARSMRDIWAEPDEQAERELTVTGA